MPEMAILEQHHSPDGSLTFTVERFDNGDYCLGFDGFPWHTHGDILADQLGESEEVAIRQYVDRLLTNQLIIAIARVGEMRRDAWVTDASVADKYKPADEAIEFRYWDGTPVK
jgi:hypothetical protein